MNRFIFALLVVALVALVAPTVLGCGCESPVSIKTNQLCIHSVMDSTCVCDACPPCNSCDQLQGGCHASDLQSNVIFEPSIPSLLPAGKPFSPYKLTTNKHQTIWAACVRPDLPDGLSLTLQNSSLPWYFILSGTPTGLVPHTDYKVIVKGDDNYLGVLSFSLNIVYSGTH